MSDRKERTYPLESFGPQITQLLIEGSQRKIVVEEGLTYASAIRLQLRIQSLRKQMRIQAHPMWKVVAKAKVSVLWGAKAGFAPVEMKHNSRNYPFTKDNTVPAKVIVQPRDGEFSSALTAAGVAIKDLAADPLEDLAAPPAPPEPEPKLDTRIAPDFLDRLKNTGPRG